MNNTIPKSSVQLPLDLAFLVDCTSSMKTYLQKAIKSINEIVETISLSGKSDLRLALVEFRDEESNSLFTNIHGFTRNLREITSLLQNCQVVKDDPKAVGNCLNNALGLTWRENANKICVLISDVLPIGKDLKDIMNKMDEDNITLYCIGCKPDVTALKDFLYETICSNKASNNVMLRDPCSLSRAQLFIEQSEEFDDQEIVEYIVTTLHEVPPSGEVAYHSPPKLINQLCECRVKQRSVIGENQQTTPRSARKDTSNGLNRWRGRTNLESRLSGSNGENIFEMAASELKYSQAERMIKKVLLRENSPGGSKELNKEKSFSSNELVGRQKDSLSKKERMQEAIKATIDKIENKLSGNHVSFQQNKKETSCNAAETAFQWKYSVSKLDVNPVEIVRSQSTCSVSEFESYSQKELETWDQKIETKEKIEEIKKRYSPENLKEVKELTAEEKEIVENIKKRYIEEPRQAVTMSTATNTSPSVMKRDDEVIEERIIDRIIRKYCGELPQVKQTVESLSSNEGMKSPTLDKEKIDEVKRIFDEARELKRDCKTAEKPVNQEKTEIKGERASEEVSDLDKRQEKIDELMRKYSRPSKIETEKDMINYDVKEETKIEPQLKLDFSISQNGKHQSRVVHLPESLAMALQDTLGINLGDKSNKICVIVAEEIQLNIMTKENKAKQPSTSCAKPEDIKKSFI